MRAMGCTSRRTFLTHVAFGAAATAFQNLSRKFADDATKLNNSLNSMAEAVTGTAQAYEQQEDQASQAVSAITATLDN